MGIPRYYTKYFVILHCMLLCTLCMFIDSKFPPHCNAPDCGVTDKQCRFGEKKFKIIITAFRLRFHSLLKRIELLQIVVWKQLPRVGLELAALGLLEKHLDLSPEEVRCF